jgi:Carboxypeptidase regulatory-like domain
LLAGIGAPTAAAQTQAVTATVTGVVADQQGTPVYGIEVEAVPTGFPCPAGYICGPVATSGPNGSFTIELPYAGGYEIEAQDEDATIDERTIDAADGSTTTVDITLPAAPVPGGTRARNAARDLGYLNAERARLGLPAGILLSSRWSLDCAAHDAYERDNHVLEHPENPRLRGASPGGAWAGLHSILAEYRWTRNVNPWWTAPIHLIQMFSPSLSVIGIDNGGGFQCATTWPGMLRAPLADDTVYTYPAAGARGVPPSEDALESPFVPGQFVGIPEGRTAGRELFVYLNQAGAVGQSYVKIQSASLRSRHGRARVKWVDNSTRTLGDYLSGGILIPVKPMRPRTRYTATVVVKVGSGTIRHTWSFTTAR